MIGDHQRAFAGVVIAVGVAVLADQAASLIPELAHLPLVRQAARGGGGSFTAPSLRLSTHLAVVNVIHSALRTGSLAGDSAGRLMFAAAAVGLAVRRNQGWIERRFVRAVFVLVAAACVSQTLSFAMRGGVVDWLAFTASGGHLLAAVALSDLYGPAAIVLVVIAGVASVAVMIHGWMRLLRSRLVAR